MKLLNNKGSVMIFTVIVIFLITILVASIITMSVSSFQLTKIASSTNSSYYISDALIEESLSKIKAITYEAEVKATNKLMSDDFKSKTKWIDFMSTLQDILLQTDKNSTELTMSEAIERYEEAIAREYREIFLKELLILVDDEITESNVNDHIGSTYQLLDDEGNWIANSETTFVDYDFSDLETEIENIEFDTTETDGDNPPTVEFTDNGDFNITIKAIGNYNDFDKVSEINLDIIVPDYSYVIETNLVTYLYNEVLNNHAILNKSSLEINNADLFVTGNLYSYGNITINNSRVITNTSGLSDNIDEGGIATAKELNITNSIVNVNGEEDAFRRRFNGNIYANILNIDNSNVYAEQYIHVRKSKEVHDSTNSIIKRYYDNSGDYEEIERMDRYMHLLSEDGDSNIDYNIVINNDTEDNSTNELFTNLTDWNLGNANEFEGDSEEGSSGDIVVFYNPPDNESHKLYINPIPTDDVSNNKDIDLAGNVNGIIASKSDIVLRPPESGELYFKGIIISMGTITIEGRPSDGAYDTQNDINIIFDKPTVYRLIEQYDNSNNKLSHFFNLYNGRHLEIDQTSIIPNTSGDNERNLEMTIHSYDKDNKRDITIAFEQGTNGIDLKSVSRAEDIKTYEINYWKQVD